MGRRPQQLLTQREHRHRCRTQHKRHPLPTLHTSFPQTRGMKPLQHPGRILHQQEPVRHHGRQPPLKSRLVQESEQLTASAGPQHSRGAKVLLPCEIDHQAQRPSRQHASQSGLSLHPPLKCPDAITVRAQSPAQLRAA